MTDLAPAQATEPMALRYPWQQSPWDHLLALRQSERLPHAMLLCGAAGIGKRRFATAFAQLLLCECPRDGQACGSCRQCLFIRAGSHPDLRFLSPEDKSRVIKVDQVRELLGFLTQTAMQGCYKVAVISPAEAMNINAANALLKCLEEPSGDTLLLLLSDSPSRVLPTIRSRCQRIELPMPSWDQSLQWLGTVIGGDCDRQALLQLAGGRPVAALAMHEADTLRVHQRMQQELLAMLLGRSSVLDLAQQWLEHDLATVLSWLWRCCAEWIVARQAAGALDAQWQAWLQQVDLHRLHRLAERLATLAAGHERGANPNHQLLLEDIFLQFRALTE